MNISRTIQGHAEKVPNHTVHLLAMIHNKKLTFDDFVTMIRLGLLIWKTIRCVIPDVAADVADDASVERLRMRSRQAEDTCTEGSTAISHLFAACLIEELGMVCQRYGPKEDVMAAIMITLFADVRGRISILRPASMVLDIRIVGKSSKEGERDFVSKGVLRYVVERMRTHLCETFSTNR